MAGVGRVLGAREGGGVGGGVGTCPDFACSPTLNIGAPVMAATRGQVGRGRTGKSR